MFGLFMKKMLGNNEYRNWMIEVSTKMKLTVTLVTKTLFMQEHVTVHFSSL